MNMARASHEGNGPGMDFRFASSAKPGDRQPSGGLYVCMCALSVTMQRSRSVKAHVDGATYFRITIFILGLVDVRERAHLYDGWHRIVLRVVNLHRPCRRGLKRHISTMLASNCPSFAIARSQNPGDMLQIKKKKIYFDTEP